MSEETVPPPRRSLGCARCGDCCTDIPLPVNPDRYRAEDLSPDTSLGRDMLFIKEHWTPVEGKRDTYACDRFDPVHRLCLAQEGKPPVCADYPAYGSRLEELAAHLPPRCSYLLDAAPDVRPEGVRPLIPVEVLRG